MGVSQVMNTVRTEVSVPDPLDPFGFEEESQSEPIDDEERAALLDDLADLAEFREALEPRGFRGVVIPCPDCEEDHFFSWSLLRENLEHILERGEPRVHEPAFEPDVDRYVPWDYARGFVDGLLEGERETTSLRDGWTSPVEASRHPPDAFSTAFSTAPPAVGPACLQGVIFFPQIVPLCWERPCGTGSSTLRFPSRPSRCSPASRSPAAG